MNKYGNMNKPRAVQARHIIIVIETAEFCQSADQYDTASHTLWDELYVILRGEKSPFYKRVKGVTNIECQASYDMQRGIEFELLLELQSEEGQIADLSKPALQKVLNAHWGIGALVASKKVVLSIVQHALFELNAAPATFAEMAVAGAPAPEAWTLS